MTGILIFYASIGSGHYSAARSIETALKDQQPALPVRVEDVFVRHGRSPGLDWLSGYLTRTFPGIYTWSWQTGSLRWVFELTWRLPWLRSRVDRLIREIQPDLVVCTHALPCAMAAASGKTPVMAVATDFAEHPYWPVKNIQAFVVAGETGRRNLVRRGLTGELIYPYGIPIRPVPAVPLALHTEDRPLQVLVMAGGGQMGPYIPILPKVRDLLRRLTADMTPGIHWKFVFGRNNDLLEHARRQLGDRPDVELLGFVPDLPDHLAAADLLVTKPGGLTLAEACGMGKPVLLLTRGAGQEHANAGVILQAGAGRLTPGAGQILDTVRELQIDRAHLVRMAGCARELGRPRAAENTARLILSLSAANRL